MIYTGSNYLQYPGMLSNSKMLQSLTLNNFQITKYFWTNKCPTLKKKERKKNNITAVKQQLLSNLYKMFFIKLTCKIASRNPTGSYFAFSSLFRVLMRCPWSVGFSALVVIQQTTVGNKYHCQMKLSLTGSNTTTILTRHVLKSEGLPLL